MTPAEVREAEQRISKLCTGCNTEKPLNEFYQYKSGPRSLGPDTYVHRCKTCLSAYYAARYRVTPAIKERGKAYEQSERGKSRRRAYEKRPERREHQRRAAKRPHRQEYARNYQRLYYCRPGVKLRMKAAIARRRAAMKEAGGRYTVADVVRIEKLQKHRCAICRKQLHDDYHIDHITPIARGGHSNPSNIQLLCAVCNQRKSSKDPIAHMQSLGRLL